MRHGAAIVQATEARRPPKPENWGTMSNAAQAGELGHNEQGPTGGPETTSGQLGEHDQNSETDSGHYDGGETAGAARATTAATVATAAAIAARGAEVTITTADATARAAAGAAEAGQPPPKNADWDNMTRKQKQHWHQRRLG